MISRALEIKAKAKKALLLSLSILSNILNLQMKKTCLENNEKENISHSRPF